MDLQRISGLTHVADLTVVGSLLVVHVFRSFPGKLVSAADTDTKLQFDDVIMLLLLRSEPLGSGSVRMDLFSLDM